MLVARTFRELEAGRAAATRDGRPLALVPTMGALHDGHRALIEAAEQRGAAVAASIFVNPMQFDAAEDLAGYPRDEAGDLAVLREAGCSLVWVPTVEIMYPPKAASAIDVGGPALRWEGAARPGHFRGVATVVAKLFGQVRPAMACFGEKDWQQLQVVRRMVCDLSFGVEIVAVPTTRAADGLALSSRNRLLSAAERLVAPQLYKTLETLALALKEGGEVERSITEAVERLRVAGFSTDYIALVHAETLEPLTRTEPPARLILAAKLGMARLIDNVAVI